MKNGRWNASWWFQSYYEHVFENQLGLEVLKIKSAIRIFKFKKWAFTYYKYCNRMIDKVLINLPSARWVIPPEPAPVRDGRQCLQSWAKFTGVPPTTQPLSFFVCSQWLKSYTCKLVIDDWPSVRHLLKDSSMQFFSCSLSHSKTHLISDTSSRLRGVWACDYRDIRYCWKGWYISFMLLIRLSESRGTDFFHHFVAYIEYIVKLTASQN